MSGGQGRKPEVRLDPSQYALMHLERVTLDSGILIGSKNLEFAIAAKLGFYRGHWSTWITYEFTRVRTAMVVGRAYRELGIVSGSEADPSIQGGIEERLRRSRARVGLAVRDFTSVLTTVNYQEAEGADLSWLKDADDHPIMQTAIAVGVPGVLVTDNSEDFPIGEVRNGIFIVSSKMFLDYIFQRYPEAEAFVSRQAEARRAVLKAGRLPEPL